MKTHKKIYDDKAKYKKYLARAVKIHPEVDVMQLYANRGNSDSEEDLEHHGETGAHHGETGAHHGETGAHHGETGAHHGETGAHGETGEHESSDEDEDYHPELDLDSGSSEDEEFVSGKLSKIICILCQSNLHYGRGCHFPGKPGNVLFGKYGWTCGVVH